MLTTYMLAERMIRERFEVHSVYRHTVNLRSFPGDQLTAVHGSRYDATPVSVVLPTENLPETIQNYAKPGMKALFTDRCLMIGEMRLETGDMKLWDPLIRRGLSSAECSALLESILDLLETEAVPGAGFGDSACRILRPGTWTDKKDRTDDSSLSGICATMLTDRAQAMWEASARLMDRADPPGKVDGIHGSSARILNRADSPEECLGNDESAVRSLNSAVPQEGDGRISEAVKMHVGSLIGAGSGLTPSGDDFLTGLLFAAHICGDIPSYWKAALSGSVRECLGYTNAISRAYLSCALAGSFGMPYHDLLRRDSRVRAIRRILSVGHSSGTDTLNGIAIGLSLCAEGTGGGKA